MGAVVLVVTLDRQLTQYYWHNLPKEAGFPFLALVEHTNFIPPRTLRRRPHHLLRRLSEPGPRVLPAEQRRALLERFLPAFTRFNPAFDRSWVKDTWLWKTAYAQPIPPVNHSQNIPPISARPCRASTSPA